MIKAIIFDLDGVLVFTDQLHYQAWKNVAEQIGVAFDEQVNERLRGVSRKESLEIITEQAGVQLTEIEKEQWMEKKNRFYVQLLKNMGAEDVSLKVRETLKLLRNSGYRLAIGSSSKNAERIVRQVEIWDYFDVISDGNGLKKSKPFPEVFLKAAKMLDVEPQACMVVEDAYAGIDAAKAAGMIAVGMGSAANYEKSDFVIDRIEDLLKLLK